MVMRGAQQDNRAGEGGPTADDANGHGYYRDWASCLKNSITSVQRSQRAKRKSGFLRS